ncbi:unnamed protein product [Peronospora belbahrii]|uniref:BHLH domain-containing protein n=1 Tax=Peronospora belbahrii TaxID=622444 RepID=A0ABN8D2R5_9STRA|nr:unnamed protein product [Peronospora belbahrii]
MDFDDDMSGLQIEDLGEYFLQTDINDDWKGFSLGYTDDRHEQTHSQHQEAKAHDYETIFSCASGDGTSIHHSTSSPVTLRYNIGLEMALDSGSAKTDMATLYETQLTPVRTRLDVAMLMNQKTKDAMDFSDFSLDQHKELMALAMPKSASLVEVPTTIGDSVSDSVASHLPSLQCQHILSSDNDKLNAFNGGEPFRREVDFMTGSCYPNTCSTIASKSTNSAPSLTLEDDRGFRKKSREKMRRQEVNVKFDELIDLLGLSNRVRKSAILQEAVSTIKSLKRERDELRHDRDRLQQEVRKLATCLQYSNLGSVAAANAMTQHRIPSAQYLNQQHVTAAPSGFEAVHTHPLSIPCNPGTNCFPLSGKQSFTHLGPITKMNKSRGIIELDLQTATGLTGFRLDAL